MGPTDMSLTHNSSSGQHAILMDSTNGISLLPTGQMSVGIEKESNSIRDPEYRNLFPDANGEAGVSMSNFHFEDFFGNDPNAFNMQFWPTDFVRPASLAS